MEAVLPAAGDDHDHDVGHGSNAGACRGLLLLLLLVMMTMMIVTVMMVVVLLLLMVMMVPATLGHMGGLLLCLGLPGGLRCGSTCP